MVSSSSNTKSLVNRSRKFHDHSVLRHCPVLLRLVESTRWRSHRILGLNFFALTNELWIVRRCLVFQLQKLTNSFSFRSKTFLPLDEFISDEHFSNWASDNTSGKNLENVVVSVGFGIAQDGNRWFQLYKSTQSTGTENGPELHWIIPLSLAPAWCESCIFRFLSERRFQLQCRLETSSNWQQMASWIARKIAEFRTWLLCFSPKAKCIIYHLSCVMMDNK